MENEAADFFIGGFLGLLAWFFGGLDGYLSVLITLIVINFILRSLDNVINRNVSFYEFFKNVGNKVTILGGVVIKY